MIAPCKDCTKRETGCHSQCQPYKTFRFFYNWRNAVIRETKGKETSYPYRASRNASIYYSNIYSQAGKKIKTRT